MALFRRRAPAADPTELARAVAAEIVKAMPSLPAGSVAHTAESVIARANASASSGQIAAALPRDNLGAGYPMGPGMPLVPAPLDPVDASGRAQPRRFEYPVSWNLPGAGQKLIPFQVLRDVADSCDLVRRCIEIRKSEVVSLEWDITLSDDAIDQIMATSGERNRARAAAKARDSHIDEIDALRRFWEEPDRLNGMSMSEWLNALLEEHFVLDAVSVYPNPTLGAPVVDGLASSIHSFVVLDGSTIKPLLDNRGNVPRPPAPAAVQTLYGYPRGEFMITDEEEVAAAFVGDQIFYRPRNRRTFTPYGFPPVEQVLPLVDLYLKRSEWLRAEYGTGASPNTWLKPVGIAETWNPDQRRAYEVALNADLSGNTEARHQLKLLPPSFDPIEMKEFGEKYTAELDEHIIKQVGSYFDVLPTQLGIVPRRGLGGAGHQEGEQDLADAQAKEPLKAWLVDLLNDLSRMYLGMDPALTFVLRGGKVEDELNRIKGRQIELTSGQKTLNALMAETGEPLYDFAEADMPFVLSGTGGVIFLEGASSTPASPQLPDGPLAPIAGTGGRQPVDSPAKRPAKPAKPKAKVGDEARKFVSFAERRIGADKPWRDFDFATVEAELAKALNAAGAAGDLDGIKALVVGGPLQRSDRPGPRFRY